MKIRKTIFDLLCGSLAFCLVFGVLPSAGVQGRQKPRPHKLSLALRTAMSEGRTTRVIVQAVAGQSSAIAYGIARSGAAIDDVVDTTDTVAATVTPDHLTALE